MTMITRKQTYRCTINGHYKQWSCWVEDSPGSRGYILVSEYGKIGATQQTTRKFYGTAFAAESAMNEKINEKLGKGYMLHQTDPASSPRVVAARQAMAERGYTTPTTSPAEPPAPVRVPGRRMLDL